VEPVNPEDTVFADQRLRRCENVLRPTAPNGATITGAVLGTSNGTELDSHNVRRSFRRIVTVAGLDASQWTPREMRHSFVSLLSDSGMPLEHISGLVGHSGTAVTEAVYRQQLRPMLDEGATAMDDIFPAADAG